VHELTIRLGDVTTLPWASGEPLSTEVGEPVEACLIGDDPCEPTHPTLGIGTEGEETGLGAVTSTASHFVLTDPNHAAEPVCESDCVSGFPPPGGEESPWKPL